MQLELNTETLPSIYHISWLLRLPFKHFPKPHGPWLQSGEGGLVQGVISVLGFLLGGV